MKINRRRFLAAAILGAPCMAVADAKWVEPQWVKTRTVRLGSATPTHRIVHFTDVHHKGDRAYLNTVVRQINGLSPDLVCFTGDLVEEKEHLPEALELLAGIKSPLYGVPGNHDYWSHANFDDIARVFQKTGGEWLMDRNTLTHDGRINVLGVTCRSGKQMPLPLNPKTRNVLLVHYPNWVKKLTQQFDVVLAGHSHGGQVRLPFYGPIVVAFGVDEYDLGLYQTHAGPLYVNPGIGWFYAPVRFRCRPEITVFEI